MCTCIAHHVWDKIVTETDIGCLLVAKVVDSMLAKF